MHATLENENSIAYTGLFGDRKRHHVSDMKELWRDTHREEKVEGSESVLFGKWVQSQPCIVPNELTGGISFSGDVFLCSYVTDSDKKIREKIKAMLTDKFYGGGSPVELTIAEIKVSELDTEFNELAGQWYKETRKLSSIHQIILHPAYQKIIGMGEQALPLIFKELKKSRGHWLWALHMIVRKDHAEKGQNFRQAVDSWLEWGEQMGYV